MRMANVKPMIRCHGEGVMFIEKIDSRSVEPGEEGRRQFLLPTARKIIWLARYAGHCHGVFWFIGQICQNMIFLFNDYNYQMKIIQMIFLLQRVLPPGHDGCSHQNTCVATLDQNLKYIKKEMTHQH